MTALMSRDGQFHGGLAASVGLLDVHFGSKVPCGTLQIVGHGPMILIAMGFPHHVGNHRPHAAKLGVAEGILGAGLGQELAIRMAAPSETTMTQ